MRACKVLGVERKGAFYVLTAKPERGKLKFSGGQVAKVLPARNSREFAVLYFYSGPKDKELRFVLDTATKVKAELAAKKKGSKIFVDGPHGKFKIRKKSGTAVFVAKRLGLVPVHAMVSELMASRTRPKIIILSESANRASIPDEEGLRKLAKQKGVKVGMALLAEKPLNWDGKLGELAARDIAAVKGSKSAQYYIAGPIPFVNRVKAMLSELKIPEKNMSFEQWG